MKKIMIVLVLFHTHLYAQAYSNEPLDTYGTGDRFKCFRTNETGVRKEVSCEDDLNLSSEKKRQINEIKKYQAELETLNTQLVTKPYTSLDNLDKTNKGVPDELISIIKDFSNNIGFELDTGKNRNTLFIESYLYTSNTFENLKGNMRRYAEQEKLPIYYRAKHFYKEDSFYSNEKLMRYKVVFTDFEFSFLLKNKDILYIQPIYTIIEWAYYGEKKSE